MIGPRQEQELAGDGMAVQAARDVNVKFEQHYHGLQVADVEPLVQLFLEKHLPALREEATAVMRENAAEFLREFSSRLAATEKITQEAFAKPDSQVCFQEALKGSAEKGDQIDLALLADMVIGRLESDENPLLKLLYEDSVRVLPRLTGPHVAFLLYLVWMRNVRHVNFQSTAQLEQRAAIVGHVAKDGLAISDVNKEYLVSVGVLTVNHVTDADTMMGVMTANYPFLPKSREQLQVEAPALFALVEAWGKYSHPLCHLTGTGKLIGLLALQRIYGPLDMSIWIN